MDKLPADINPDRRGNFLFELPTFFPNFMIHVYSGGGGDPGMLYFTHQFWPLAVDKTLWETTRYWRAPRRARANTLPSPMRMPSTEMHTWKIRQPWKIPSRGCNRVYWSICR